MPVFLVEKYVKTSKIAAHIAYMFTYERALIRLSVWLLIITVCLRLVFAIRTVNHTLSRNDRFMIDSLDVATDDINGRRLFCDGSSGVASVRPQRSTYKIYKIPLNPTHHWPTEARWPLSPMDRNDR